MSETLDTSTFVSTEQGGAEPQPVETPIETPAESQDDPGDANPEVNDEAVEQPSEGGEPEQPQPKKKQSAQDRIDELTRARREAEREARHWRDMAEGRTKPNGHDQQAQPEAAPDPMNYDLGETDPAYIQAVIDHGIKKGLDSVETRVAQNMHIQAQERAWEAKQDEARSKFADYDAKVIDGAENWDCTPQMAVAIRTSDAGGELAYHLASNPDEARRIARLDPISQIRALGRLEGQLSAPSQEAPTPAPKPKTATTAPKPAATQVRGAGGQFSVAPDTDDFTAFEKSYGDRIN